MPWATVAQGKVSSEEACHNRDRLLKGRTDGGVPFHKLLGDWIMSRHPLARFNHDVDLLAGIMVNLGRNRDLEFYGALQTLQRAGYYFTKAGQPIV